MDSTIDWLLAGDPSIRWQTMRDLAGASPAVLARERRKVEREGWGAGLLAKQNSRGTWAGGSSPDIGLYTPKWTSTTYTMLLLRDFGLVPSERMRAPCRILLDRGQQPDGGVTFGASAKRARGETCITGMVLSLAAYFELDDPRLGDAIDLLRKAQGDNGRWPLRYAYKGDTYLQLERIGAPSRWNTLRALRVLEWWHDGR